VNTDKRYDGVSRRKEIMKVITLIKNFLSVIFVFLFFLNSCETLDEKELKEKRDKETFEQNYESA
jgi:hypothetical protein